jgi:pyrroloquinoline-quinone synthase
METLTAKLEEKIQAKSLLQHTFYQRWQMGELSKEELQGYAKEYYAFEKEFPRFISALHSKCPDQTMRQELLENLIHEERGEENHLELWLRFAEGLGVSREEVKAHFHSDETEHLLRVFRKHAAKPSMVAGLAALYAYEKQQPDVATSKIEGLEKFYGAKDKNTTAFFRAHQHYDVIHSETEAKLLSDLCQDEVSQAEALKATEETLGALYDFLDGVERRYRKAA